MYSKNYWQEISMQEFINNSVLTEVNNFTNSVERQKYELLWDRSNYGLI